MSGIQNTSVVWAIHTQLVNLYQNTTWQSEQHCTVLCGRSVLDVSSWWSCCWDDASTPSTLLRVHGSQVLWTHRGGRAASQLASFDSLDTDQRRLYQLSPTSCRLRRRPSWGSHVDDLLSLTAAFQGRPTLRSWSRSIITRLLFVPFVGISHAQQLSFSFSFSLIVIYIRVNL